MFSAKKLTTTPSIPQSISDLIPICKSGSVREVIEYLQAHPNEIFIPVPTEMYVSDQKTGLKLIKTDMNILTYCLLYADYDLFVGIVMTIDESNRKLMEKFYDEVLKACKTASYALSFAQVLAEYKEAITSFKTFKDAKALGDIMARLPPYVLQAMCFPNWRAKSHFDNMTSERRIRRSFMVMQDSDQAKVEMKTLFKTAKSGQVVSPMLYCGTGEECRVVDKSKSHFSHVKILSSLDYEYMLAVLSARIMQIYTKIMELAIYMENNLAVKGSWLRFVSLKERGADSSDFIRRVSELFQGVLYNEKTQQVYHSMIKLLKSKDEPRQSSAERQGVAVVSQPIAPVASVPPVAPVVSVEPVAPVAQEPAIIAAPIDPAYLIRPSRKGYVWFNNPTAPSAADLGISDNDVERRRPLPPTPQPRIK
jgi:hypothetical protein